jgi:hypothetical protein
MTRRAHISIIFILFILVSVANSQTTVHLTKNPYADVNWATDTQYKANFHTHTTNSNDASLTPSTVINAYYSKGYSILAITDHNRTTWPWPINPGMLAIRGNEYSTSHHLNALLKFSSNSNNLESGIPHIQSNGGLAQINHPGRYHSPTEWAWYIPWYRDYSSCIALEVFNQGDKYSDDRKLWDNINENYFTQYGKFVWGTSNDDMHNTPSLYGNFQFMLMSELTETALRESFTNGAFYFCYEPGRTGDAQVPRISNIVVDDDAKTITITATGYATILWTGPGTSIVETGMVFDYSAYTNKAFIRAVLKGNNGDSYTQPFGFETTTVGVENTLKENSFSLYPNPNNGTFMLDYKAENQGDYKVLIFDVTGRQVFNSVYRNSNNSLSTPITLTISEGVYIVQVIENNIVSSKHFIVFL